MNDDQRTGDAGGDRHAGQQEAAGTALEQEQAIARPMVW